MSDMTTTTVTGGGSALVVSQATWQAVKAYSKVPGVRSGSRVRELQSFLGRFVKSAIETARPRGERDAETRRQPAESGCG